MRRTRKEIPRKLRNQFQSTHSLRSATSVMHRFRRYRGFQSTHSLRSATAGEHLARAGRPCFNPRTPCGVRQKNTKESPTLYMFQSTHSLRSATGQQRNTKLNDRKFQSTHSLRSATAPNLIHCYSTKQIILCANLPKKTVIARLLFLSIYLSIFYSQCITPIADLPGNSCELEVGAQAMFNSL